METFWGYLRSSRADLFPWMKVFADRVAKKGGAQKMEAFFGCLRSSRADLFSWTMVFAHRVAHRGGQTMETFFECLLSSKADLFSWTKVLAHRVAHRGGQTIDTFCGCLRIQGRSVPLDEGARALGCEDGGLENSYLFRCAFEALWPIRLGRRCSGIGLRTESGGSACFQIKACITSRVANGDEYGRTSFTTWVSR